MSSNLVIVAIPAEDDYVWKLSSEKVPHCTLLFLGDSLTNPHVQQIVEFVEHAVTVRDSGPFGLEVDHRGTLGVDEADVLFFDTECWDCKDLAKFRAQLLQDNNIKTAYDSTEQFPVWQPHLTMGYPATPAHEDTREFPGTTYVRFDRIAVWLGDFDGPEFRLKWKHSNPEAIGWSMDGSTTVEEILSHHGVKGMRWGVRNDSGVRNAYANRVKGEAADLHKIASRLKKGTATEQDIKKAGTSDASLARAKAEALSSHASRTKVGSGSKTDHKQYLANRTQEDISAGKQKKANADARWENLQIHGRPNATTGYIGVRGKAEIKAITSANKQTRKDLSALHKKPEYAQARKDGTFKRFERNPHLGQLVSGKKGSKGTIEEQAKASVLRKKYEKDVSDIWMKNLNTAVSKLPNSPSGRMKLEVQGGKFWYITAQQVAHAVTGDVFLAAIPVLDDDGFIVDFEPLEDGAMQQSEAFVEDFLEHHGIKGMKWGVRSKRTAAPVTPVAAKVTTTPHAKKAVKVEVEGGSGHDAHTDAIKVAEARQKMAKSGTSALSNHELQSVATRLQLESNVARLEAERASGKGFVSGLLRKHGRQSVDQAVGKAARSGVDSAFKTAAKRTAKAAVVSAI